MLSRCQDFTTQTAYVKKLLGPEVAFTGVLIDSEGGRHGVRILGWDTWELTVGDQIFIETATNIKAICRIARLRLPAPVVAVRFEVTAGGNTWNAEVPMSLSNPEAVAGGFANLFRAIVNERNLQSECADPQAS